MFNRYQSSGNNRRKIVIGAGLLALLLILGIMGFRLFSGKDKGPDSPNNPSAGITYDQNAEEGGWSALSEEEIAAALNSKVEEGMINISMNTSPIFPDGKSEGNLMIVNELVNTYPQQVELIRNDTDEAAVQNGLLKGDDRGLLRPDGNLTRAEMAAIINRAFGAYQTTDISQFRDVQSGKWYYEDMRKAVHMGTYAGNGNGTMTPDNPISREEAMTVVARALQLDTADYSGTDLSGFADQNAVSSWAVPYVKAMVGADYIHGNTQRQLTPRANITRAEFAQIFFNVIKEYVLTAGEYTGNRTGNLLVRTNGVTLKNMTINGDLIIGCGAADGAVTLDNVTVTGRVVVWGGGTNAVYVSETCRYCGDETDYYRESHSLRNYYDSYSSSQHTYESYCVDCGETIDTYRESHRWSYSSKAGIRYITFFFQTASSQPGR